tara:strand:- start:306 stop:968 length:663 start_codon:yes stop_codon:yes gene_type:complete
MGRHWHRRHTRRHLRRKRNKKVLWITFGVIITLIIISNWPAISNYLGDFKPIVSEGNNLIEKVTDPLTHDVDISLIELEINTLINEERTKEGLSILGLEDSVSDVARIHSQDMLDNNFFDHINLKGEDPTSRGIKSGVTCYKDYESYYTEGFAENLGGSPFGNVVGCGYVYSEKSLAKCMVDGWMESQGHRENILTPDYDETGIGVACDYSQCYGTQMFC